MNPFIFFLALSLFLPPLTFLLAFFLSARSSADREKMSAYECGFDPINSARVPFSLRFFLLAVIFLMFDIEIALILPLPMALASAAASPTPIVTSFLFLMILLMGLMFEWREGGLNWSE